MKAIVLSLDDDTDFFAIIEFCKEIALYMLIICLDYVPQTSIYQIKGNGITLKQTRNRYHSETLTDTDYANNLALLANAPSRAESLLYKLEQAPGGIGVFANVNKTDYM